MTLDEMLPLVRKLIKKDMHNAMPNGVICLKGGDLTEELKKHKDVLVDNLDVYFDEPFFETKKIVYLPV